MSTPQSDAKKLGQNSHRENDTAANCRGTTFDQGDSNIAEDPVKFISRDNYAKLNTDQRRIDFRSH
jgi:hypothetical protein